MSALWTAAALALLGGAAAVAVYAVVRPSWTRPLLGKNLAKTLARRAGRG